MDLSTHIRKIKYMEKQLRNPNSYIYTVSQHPLVIDFHKENLFNYGGDIQVYNSKIAEDWNCVNALLDKRPSCVNAIEIGTKWGEWTRLLGKRFSLIYCFEPIASQIDMLSYNCVVKKLKVYNCCAGASFKSVSMYGTSIYNSNTERSLKKKSKIRQMRTIPIDKINPDNIDLIRISANGYELPVLKGAIETIRKYKPIIIIQQAGLDIEWRPLESTRNEAMSFLFDIGMHLITKIYNDHYVFDWNPICNIVSLNEYLTFNNEDLTDSYEFQGITSDDEDSYEFPGIISDDEDNEDNEDKLDHHETT